LTTAIKISWKSIFSIWSLALNLVSWPAKMQLSPSSCSYPNRVFFHSTVSTPPACCLCPVCGTILLIVWYHAVCSSRKGAHSSLTELFNCFLVCLYICNLHIHFAYPPCLIIVLTFCQKYFNCIFINTLFENPLSCSPLIEINRLIVHIV